jgi:hypothetical protein
MSSMFPLTWLIGQWAKSAHVKFEVDSDLATRPKSPLEDADLLHHIGHGSVRESDLWLKDMLCSLAELLLSLTTQSANSWWKLCTTCFNFSRVRS